MKQVDSKVYTKEYYLNVCLGSEDYKKHKGNVLNKIWEKNLSLVKFKKGDKVLDLGCGRGEVAFYLAKRGVSVVGIDYSSDAIELAKKSLSYMPIKIKKLVKFYKMDAKEINFNNNSFDKVVSFDVFEHLYKEEIKIVLKKISKILKKKGILLVHTETNKIYLDFTHKYYTYPMSKILVSINKLIFKKEYSSLSKDPRNEYHKLQHVNEPTIFYLKKIFKLNSFKGKIISNNGLLKPILSWKDSLYNLLVVLFPLSSFPPFNIFFSTDYVCIMVNNKK